MGNTIFPPGNNPENIIINCGNYNRNITPTTFTGCETPETFLAELIEEVLEGEIPPSVLRRLSP